MDNDALRTKRLRTLVIWIAALLVVILGWVAFNYIRHKGLVKTVVLAVPSDSQITMDGQPVKGGTMYLKPGTHTFIASRQYFDSDTEKIDTKDVISSEQIYLVPQADSSQAKKYLADHPDVAMAMQDGGDAMASRSQRIINKNYPILAQLPFENEHFKIDYSLSSDNKPEFTITLYGILNRPSQYNDYLAQLKQYKQEALQYLSSHGIKPANYKITYSPNDPGQ